MRTNCLLSGKSCVHGGPPSCPVDPVKWFWHLQIVLRAKRRKAVDQRWDGLLSLAQKSLGFPSAGFLGCQKAWGKQSQPLQPQTVLAPQESFELRLNSLSSQSELGQSQMSCTLKSVKNSTALKSRLNYASDKVNGWLWVEYSSKYSLPWSSWQMWVPTLNVAKPPTETHSKKRAGDTVYHLPECSAISSCW